jgi:hypothetical protein
MMQCNALENIFNKTSMWVNQCHLHPPSPRKITIFWWYVETMPRKSDMGGEFGFSQHSSGRPRESFPNFQRDDLFLVGG